MLTLVLKPITLSNENIVGDMDGDGVITSTDVRIVLWAVNQVITLTDALIEAADVNMDGILSNDDAQLILKKAVGTLGWLT